MDVIFDLHPKQDLLIHSDATEILYGGAAGGGKSMAARLAAICYASAIPGLQIYMFRREFADILRNHMDGPTGFRALLAPLEQRGLVVIREKDIEWKKTGSKINLCHCQHEKDVFGYQGAEMHCLIIEEATQFTEFQLRYLRSRVRMPDTIKLPLEWRGKFPRVIYLTNPGGPGHVYLKRALWEPAQALTPYNTWRAAGEDGGFIRQFIPAKLSDNPSLNYAEYANTLRGIGSPHYVKALLDGDWSVIVGAFFSELQETIHRIPDLLIPQHWFKFCWYDWGYSSPAANLWFATSDGEAVWTRHDKQLTLPRGALVVYRELYIANEHDWTKGAQMCNRDQARNIRKHSAGDNVSVYLADGRPFHRDGRSLTSCPAQEFLEEGIRLVKGDTARESGWSLAHTRLQANPPLLYFSNSCEYTWRSMTMLQASATRPEDSEDGYLDECPDCVRGACTVQRIVKDKATPTAQIVERSLKAPMTINTILQSNGNIPIN